jgi:hypothetical protein
MNFLGVLPKESAGLRLARIDSRENLILCEAVCFVAGLPGVDTVLRRAAISGRVEVNGKIENHFADVLDANGSMIEIVALDAGSYRALKTHWMRCKVERE